MHGLGSGNALAELGRVSFDHGGDVAAGSFAPIAEGEGFPDRLQHRLRSRLGLRDSVCDRGLHDLKGIEGKRQLFAVDG